MLASLACQNEDLKSVRYESHPQERLERLSGATERRNSAAKDKTVRSRTKTEVAESDDGQPVSELLGAEFSPGFSSPEAISASLTLPNVLTTGAGDRLRWMFFCKRLSTHWTIFAPHIHTVFSLTQGSVGRITLGGWSSRVCSNWNRSKSVPFCIGAPFLAALVCSRILVRRVLVFQVRRVKSRNAAPMECRTSSWSCPQFQDDSFASKPDERREGERVLSGRTCWAKRPTRSLTVVGFVSENGCWLRMFQM